MIEDIVNISIYRSNESNSLFSALEVLKEDGFNLNLRYPEFPELLLDSIIIVDEPGLDSPIINYLFDQNEIKNKIIFIVPESDSLFVSTLVKKGFTNFFVFPYEYYLFVDYLRELLENINLELNPCVNEVDLNSGFGKILGNSREIQKVIEIARKIADKKNINVLITGETGTGKGLLAKAIHDYNNESRLPFVDITCTSIPETLLESELFGYEPGAFTNAKIQKPGLFEIAENGTLFLDEIGDLSINIQSKLLRTIDKKIIRRLGGINDIPINARIISATNRNLEQSIESNNFRRDLFHRLNTVSIELPPLRSRGNDSIILANNFIDYFSLSYDKQIKKVELSLKEYITKYQWPGNIRELKNFIERAVLLCEDGILGLKQISSLTSIQGNSNPIYLHPSYINLNLEYEKTDLKMIDRLYAKETLIKLNGNKSKTAKLLGISRPKLDDLLNN